MDTVLGLRQFCVNPLSAVGHRWPNWQRTHRHNVLIDKIIKVDYPKWGADGREFKSHRPDQTKTRSPSWTQTPLIALRSISW
jgi:hypothetical protein